ILSRNCLKAEGPRLLVLFLGIYWLNPFRLLHAGILWEPSYLYFFAAVHAWAAYECREGKAGVAAFLLGAVHAATFQLHGSFLALLLLSAILWSVKLVKLSPLPLCAGVIVGSVPLLPTVSAWWRGEHLG